MEGKPANYYQNIRHDVLPFIPKRAKKVLEIGCGEGKFGECLKQQQNAEVWGVEPVKQHANNAKKVLDKVLVGGVEANLSRLPTNYFDLIVANDVLEHLVDPYYVLVKLSRTLKKGGVIVSSIPNMRNFHIIHGLTVGKNWEYQESGILDKTHLRFFTTNSIQNMFKNHGYKVIKHEGINEDPLPRWFKALTYCLPGKLDDMKYVQFVTVAKVVK